MASTVVVIRQLSPEIGFGQVQFASIVLPKMNSGKEFPSVFAALRRDKSACIRFHVISARQVISVIAKLRAPSRHDPSPRRHSEFSFTRHLTPALSPNSRWRRGRIIRRLFEDSRDWICRTAFRQPETIRRVVLSWGRGNR
jgi:hypothetical protein